MEIIDSKIATQKANDDFAGLGQTLKDLFKLPQNLCKVRGNCCKVATFKGSLNVDDIRQMAQDPNNPDAQNARDFLTLFIPYETLDEVQAMAPVFVERVAKHSKVENPENISFFHCRFLGDNGACQVHEDRPTGCRAYPFPHDSTIYHPGCGFEKQGTENWQRIQDIMTFFEKRLNEMNHQAQSS